MKLKKLIISGLLTALIAGCSGGGIISEDSLDGDMDPVSFLLLPFGKPQNLKATSGETGFITVSWDRIMKADAYTVQRASAIDGEYKIIAQQVKALSFKDTNLPEMGSGNTYFYKVKGIILDKEGNEKASGFYSYPMEGYCTDPADNLNIEFTNINAVLNHENDDNIVKYTQIFWDATAGAAYYKILRAAEDVEGNTGNFEFLKNEEGYEVTVIESPADDFYTSAATTYHYKIVPCIYDSIIGREVSGTPSDEATITTLGEAPSLTISMGTEPATPSLEISWEAVENATGYKLYKYAELGQPATDTFDVSGTTFTDSPVDVGQQFFYNLSVLFDIEEDGSPVTVATPAGNPAAGLFFSPPEKVEDPLLGESNNSITLKWRRSQTNPDDSPFYNLYYSNSPDENFKLVSTQIKIGTPDNPGKPGLSYDTPTETFTYVFTDSTINGGYAYFRIFNTTVDEIEAEIPLELTGYFIPEPPVNVIASGGMNGTSAIATAGNSVEISWEAPADNGVTAFAVYRAPVIYSKTQNGEKTTVVISRNELSGPIPHDVSTPPIPGLVKLGENITNDGSASFTYTDSTLRPGLHEYFVASLSDDIATAIPSGLSAYTTDDGHRDITNKEFIQEANKYFDFAIRCLKNGDNDSAYDPADDYQLIQLDSEGNPSGGTFDLDSADKSFYLNQHKYGFTNFNTGYLIFNSESWTEGGVITGLTESGLLIDDHGVNGYIANQNKDSTRNGRLNISGLYSGFIDHKIARTYKQRYAPGGTKHSIYDTTMNISDLWPNGDGGEPDQGYYMVSQNGADAVKIHYEEGMSVDHTDGESAYNNGLNAQEQIVEPSYDAANPYYPVWE
jgi:hypothetical protein